VVALTSSLTSATGAAFLERVVTQFPFPLQAIQTDGGSEFLGAFTETVQRLGLVRYVNRPNYPQGNGRIERSFRTDEESASGGYQVEELPADLGGRQAALLAWNQRYETWRPHQALGYLTPEQFYQKWLASNYQREEALSDIS
jgi:transposase InsO family protein